MGPRRTHVKFLGLFFTGASTRRDNRLKYKSVETVAMSNINVLFKELLGVRFSPRETKNLKFEKLNVNKLSKPQKKRRELANRLRRPQRVPRVRVPSQRFTLRT